MSDPGVNRWFSSVVTAGAPAAALSVVDELVRMLDQAQPTLLDPERSVIGPAGTTWPEYDWLIRITHKSYADAAISIAVDKDHAVVSWSNAHEHVYSEDGTAERPWMTVVVDAVAAVLRGEYVVETRYKGDRPVRATILDMADPDAPRMVSEVGTLLSSWFPWPRVTQIERSRLSYGARG